MTSARSSTTAVTCYDAVNAVSEYTELGTNDSAFFVGASVASYCPEHEAAIS